MDLDAMNKDVRGLKQFRDRVESAIAFIEGLRAAGFQPPVAEGAVVELTEDQKAQLTEIIRPISEGLAVTLNSFDDRLKQLEISKAEAEEFSDRLMTMLTWFEANREGLDILLSLDGEVDQPETGVSGASGGASGGSEAASGAISDPTGSEAPAESPAPTGEAPAA